MPSDTTNLDEFWHLSPGVRLNEKGNDHLLITRLGQRLLLKSSDVDTMDFAFNLLKTPIKLKDFHKALTGRWAVNKSDQFLKSLGSQRLVYVVKGDLNQNPPSELDGWSKFAMSFKASYQESLASLKVLQEQRLELFTDLNAPNSFLPQAKRFSSAEFSGQVASGKTSILMLSSLNFRTLDGFSALAREQKAEIIPALLDPYGAIVGPLSAEKSGYPCLSCISYRLQANLGNADHLNSMSAHALDDVVIHWPPSFWKRLESIIEDEFFKLKTKLVFSGLERGAHLFDFLNHRQSYEEVFPVADCSCAQGLRPRENQFLSVNL